MRRLLLAGLVIALLHNLAVAQVHDPRALAAGIRAVYVDPDAAVSRARAAQLRAEKEFAVEPWLRQYEKIYLNLVERSL